jgi:hypothetical protein
MLLPDDGGGMPKHVGGQIVRMYFICFVCAGNWVFDNNNCLETWIYLCF